MTWRDWASASSSLQRKEESMDDKARMAAMIAQQLQGLSFDEKRLAELADAITALVDS